MRELRLYKEKKLIDRRFFQELTLHLLYELVNPHAPESVRYFEDLRLIVEQLGSTAAATEVELGEYRLKLSPRMHGQLMLNGKQGNRMYWLDEVQCAAQLKVFIPRVESTAVFTLLSDLQRTGESTGWEEAGKTYDICFEPIKSLQLVALTPAGSIEFYWSDISNLNLDFCRLVLNRYYKNPALTAAQLLLNELKESGTSTGWSFVPSTTGKTPKSTDHTEINFTLTHTLGQ